MLTSGPRFCGSRPTSPLLAPLDAGGYPIINFHNAKSAVDIALAADPAVAFPAFNLAGFPAFAPSSRYAFAIGVRVWIYRDDTLIAAPVDLAAASNVLTDIAAVPTYTLTTVVVPDTSLVPVVLAGITANLVGGVGSLVVSATRKAGIASHARFRAWCFEMENIP